MNCTVGCPFLAHALCVPPPAAGPLLLAGPPCKQLQAVPALGWAASVFGEFSCCPRGLMTAIK